MLGEDKMTREFDELPAFDPEMAFSQEERKYYRQRVLSRFIGQPQSEVDKGLKFFVEAQEVEDPVLRDREVYKKLAEEGLINGGPAEMRQQFLDWRRMYTSSRFVWDLAFRKSEKENKEDKTDDAASS